MENHAGGLGKGTLSVMMPVFNEDRTLAVILEHVLAREEVGEVIVVDDGSTDHTWETLSTFVVQDARVKAFRQATNQGKGMAMRLAIGQLTKPFAVVQDADLEYDPRDYPQLLEPLVEQRTDVVYGVRGFGGQSAYSYWFVMGNKLVTWFTNVLFNCYISDMETGYKALRSSLWVQLCLSGKGFEIEPDITARVLRLGYQIHEVPIRYYARSRKEGKKLTWQDGVRALWTLALRRGQSQRRLFGTQDQAGHRRRQQEMATRHPLRKLSDS